MKRLPSVSDLKLRLSYGRVGNSAIGAYQTLGLLEPYVVRERHELSDGIRPGRDSESRASSGRRPTSSTLVSTTASSNQRISGSLDVYRENTHDLLLSRALPYTSGYSSVLENVGATQNTGVEVGITTQNLRNYPRNRLDDGSHWSTNKNKIVSLSSGLTADVGNLRWVGQPINVNYDYKYIGLWQIADTALARTMCGCKVGSVRVEDLNGDGKLNADDRTIIGRHYNFPKWQGSINNRFTFKSLDVSVLATARIGFTINDAFTAAYDGLGGRFNNIETNYWTPENPTGTDPRPSVDGLGNFASARNYKDGSFVRIRDITLGYTLSPAGEPVRLEGRAVVRPGAGPLHLHARTRGGIPRPASASAIRTAARPRSTRAVRRSARSSLASTSDSNSPPHAYGINHDAYTIGPRDRRPRGGGQLHGPQGVPGHGRHRRPTSKHQPVPRRRRSARYAGLRGIYGGENEIRLFMLGTDSWEKGEQFDRQRRRVLQRLHGAVHVDGRKRKRSGHVAERLLVDQHREHRHRLDHGVDGFDRRDEEHAARGESVPPRAVLLRPGSHLRRGAAQLAADRGRLDPGAPLAGGFDLFGGDHSRSRIRDCESAAQGRADRLFPRHEGRRGDAAVRGVSDACRGWRFRQGGLSSRRTSSPRASTR